MGYIRHHALAVTSWDSVRIAEAHKQAVSIFEHTVSPVLQGFINEYQTFFVAPDGSKEGWDADDAGNERRDRFVAWLSTKRYDGYVSWVEVQYGDDDLDTHIVRDSDAIGRQKSCR